MINEKQIKPLITEENIKKEIKKLGDKLNELYKDEELFVVCILKGSVMFTTELVKYLKMPVKMEFIRLSSYGSGTTSSGNVKAVDITIPDLNDKNVVVVEDIIDTGHTAKFILDFFNKNFKTKSFMFCSLLNKKSKRVVNAEADYYCFEVEDKFLVGYGLDYDGLYRNLPYIAYIE